jgi:beta-galactosidase/beta-glucuronidase
MSGNAIHRRRFQQLAGRLGAFLGMATPRLHPLAQGKKTVEGPNSLAITLDSGWLIATDPNNGGRDQSRFRAPQPGAKTTRVRSVLQETFPAYHGVVWYWVKFNAAPQPFKDGRYLLRFNAVDYLADVWLDSVHLGSHEGSETPFVLDATSLIQPGSGQHAFITCVKSG